MKSYIAFFTCFLCLLTINLHGMELSEDDRLIAMFDASGRSSSAWRDVRDYFSDKLFDYEGENTSLDDLEVSYEDVKKIVVENCDVGLEEGDVLYEQKVLLLVMIEVKKAIIEATFSQGDVILPYLKKFLVDLSRRSDCTELLDNLERVAADVPSLELLFEDDPSYYDYCLIFLSESNCWKALASFLQTRFSLSCSKNGIREALFCAAARGHLQVLVSLMLLFGCKLVDCFVAEEREYSTIQVLCSLATIKGHDLLSRWVRENVLVNRDNGRIRFRYLVGNQGLEKCE